MAIVGAGVTGCSCALTLASAGLRVRVHEAREVASGAQDDSGPGGVTGFVLVMSQTAPLPPVPVSFDDH